MDFNNYLNLNKGDTDFFLKIFKDYLKIIDENKIFNNTLRNSTKTKKENLKPSSKFYITPKTRKLIEKCIKRLKQIAPIQYLAGLYIYSQQVDVGLLKCKK